MHSCDDNKQQCDKSSWCGVKNSMEIFGCVENNYKPIITKLVCQPQRHVNYYTKESYYSYRIVENFQGVQLTDNQLTVMLKPKKDVSMHVCTCT